MDLGNLREKQSRHMKNEQTLGTRSRIVELGQRNSYVTIGTVQYRKWSPTANDPETVNDPQNGPQMIFDRKWSSKSTANDPERKIGMA